MADPLPDNINSEPSPATTRNRGKSQTWDYWLMSRLVWLLFAMVGAAVMFLIFMKIAYR